MHIVKQQLKHIIFFTFHHQLWYIIGQSRKNKNPVFKITWIFHSMYMEENTRMILRCPPDTDITVVYSLSPVYTTHGEHENSG